MLALNMNIATVPTYQIVVMLAHGAQCRQEYDKSERLYKAALDLAKRRMGEEHADVACVLYRMTELYLSQSQLDKAAETLRRLVPLLVTIVGVDSEEVRDARQTLAEIIRSDETRLAREIAEFRLRVAQLPVNRPGVGQTPDPQARRRSLRRRS